jgi:hypothetical protein
VREIRVARIVGLGSYQWPGAIGLPPFAGDERVETALTVKQGKSIGSIRLTLSFPS